MKEYVKKALLMRDKNKRTGIKNTEDSDWHCIYIFADQLWLVRKKTEESFIREKFEGRNFSIRHRIYVNYSNENSKLLRARITCVEKEQIKKIHDSIKLWCLTLHNMGVSRVQNTSHSTPTYHRECASNKRIRGWPKHSFTDLLEKNDR